MRSEGWSSRCQHSSKKETSSARWGAVGPRASAALSGRATFDRCRVGATAATRRCAEVQGVQVLQTLHFALGKRHSLHSKDHNNRTPPNFPCPLTRSYSILIAAFTVFATI